MRTALLASVLLAAAACRDLSALERPDARVDAPHVGTPDASAGADVAVDPEDGAPIRKPCTSQFGSALDTSYGRLDGILVAVIPPNTSGCVSDDDHVHLQVELAGSVYDVAVNVGIDVSTIQRDLDLGATAWSEGWHTDLGISYPALGVHAADFTTADLVEQLSTELATVNHISIYSTGFGPSGTHLVHRTSSGRDGAIVTRPLSHPSRARMYRFDNQSF